MSYTLQSFLAFDNSTDAAYRAWGSVISGVFSSGGWVQTSDPQVNWSTVTHPAAGSYNAEYWKPGDAGTLFVVKIEYGTATGGTGPSLRVTIGEGSDGSGTLTGFTTLVCTLGLGTTIAANNGTTQVFECNFFATNASIMIDMWRNGPSALGSSIKQEVVCIERTLDTSGADSGEGVNLVMFANGGSLGGCQQTLVFSRGNVAVSNAAGNGVSIYVTAFDGTASPNSANQVAVNNNVPVSPIFPVYGKIGNPITLCAFVQDSLIGEGGEFTTTLYGTSMTFVATALVRITSYPNTGAKACFRVG